ncbi:E3 ubiquitin-protein ligase makorin-1 [Biomphalaria pfeifferi]|uniref:E3 ubiquitin-protein ligase makorin-1 n=1 Tax=Biomphalaria pfeifferi TaxID=112525 RepID=A0AAD8BTT8_BIOPF|nr:E3 ubiquitin-protein ligase makorin-1 [Biomphalaria pfeifferi]
MTTLRKLDELSCKQLKEELRARELRIFCDKEKMRASLRQNLVDEGKDSETYLFEVEPDIREVMSAVLKEVNEQICTMIKQIELFVPKRNSAVEVCQFRWRSIGGSHRHREPVAHEAICTVFRGRRFLFFQLASLRWRRCRGRCFDFMTIVSDASHLTQMEVVAITVVSRAAVLRRQVSGRFPWTSRDTVVGPQVAMVSNT